MRNSLTVLIAAFIVLIIACSQNASVVSPSDAHEVMKSLMYEKDERSQICYALVASRTTMEFHQNGFTITYVPCTPGVEKLIAQHNNGE